MYQEKVKELAEKVKDFDPYFNSSDSEKFLIELQWELDEVKYEYKEWNYSKLEWEIWDVYWNFLIFLEHLSSEWKIKKENVFKKIYEKMAWRKSFLLENKKVTKEEAMKIWNDAKTKEWYPKDRLWDEKREILENT